MKIKELKIGDRIDKITIRVLDTYHPDDLPRDMRSVLMQVEPVDAVGVIVADLEIEGSAERGHAIYFPADRRGAACHGGDSTWTDADSLKDVVRRVLVTGEVVS